MNDFTSEPAEHRRQMLEAVERVLASGWYILGKEVAEFERRWADACQTKFAIGVGNGMDAIEIALRVQGIGPGDEVITTPMTAFASVLAIIRAGATPVLADIDPKTALLDPASVKRCISIKTRAVLLVHLYGQLRRMDEWESLCTEARILLVEDCAQSHLAMWKGRAGGTFGAVSAYSFYPTKNLGAIGDAGALVTSDAVMAEAAKTLRNYGQSERYHHPVLGMNSRLDEIQAAMLSAKLDRLPTLTDRRREIAARFFAEIDNKRVSLPAAPEARDAHVYHLFVVNCDDRAGLQRRLRDNGIESLIHYPIPVHHQEPCRDLKRDPKGLAAAERHAETCLSLPCHPHLSESDVVKIINTVNSFG